MTPDADMKLAKLLELYIDARNIERPINAPLAANTCRCYRENVKAFEKFLCRPAKVSDLNAECINAYLRHSFVNSRTEYSVKNYRTHLRVLWKFAHKLGLLPPWDGVQLVRVSPLNINGFDLADITKLVEHCATLRGVVRATGLRRADWWETFVLILWETGMRCGDMLRIAPADFDKDGWLWVCESKTGKRGWRRLRASVSQRVKEFIDWDDRRPFIWMGYKPRYMFRAFGQLLDDAGIPYGSMRWIRRGSASEVEKLNPGAGWKYLKHSIPTLFDKHYRVDKIVEEKPLLPPEIEANVFRPERKKR